MVSLITPFSSGPLQQRFCEAWMPLTPFDVAFPILALLPGAELSFDLNPVAEKLLTPFLSAASRFAELMRLGH